MRIWSDAHAAEQDSSSFRADVLLLAGCLASSAPSNPDRSCSMACSKPTIPSSNVLAASQSGAFWKDSLGRCGAVWCRCMWRTTLYLYQPLTHTPTLHRHTLSRNRMLASTYKAKCGTGVRLGTAHHHLSIEHVAGITVVGVRSVAYHGMSTTVVSLGNGYASYMLADR